MSAPLVQPFGPGLWLADGPTVTAIAGFHYPTRMALVALPDGGLAAWSPVPPTDDLRAEVGALGEVRALIAPNSLHHVFLGDWARAWPNARIYAPPGLAQKRPELTLHELGDTPPPDWAGVLDQVLVRGNRITTEAAFFHRPSATVLFTDLIQQFPPGWFRGWRGLVARLDLMTEPEPAVPRKFRGAFADRDAARAAIRRVLAWPAEKVVMAHGAPVEADGQAFLVRAFAWLKP